MIKHNQSGAVNSAVISLIVAILLLIGALAFGGWAFNSRQDYKNHTDAKVAAAVALAQKNQFAADQHTFDEKAKQPLKAYNGPEAYGSLVVNFPKTWSAYVDDTGGASSLVDGYFAPGSVPSTTAPNSVFALRVQVLQQAYPSVLQTFVGQQNAGLITVTAYALPLVPKSVGVKVVGQLTPDKPTVTMVVVPLRSSTLEIWTQGNQYLNDFNNNILPHFSFSP